MLRSVDWADLVEQEATSNKCIATSNKCLTSSNKKLVGTVYIYIHTYIYIYAHQTCPARGWEQVAEVLHARVRVRLYRSLVVDDIAY